MKKYKDHNIDELRDLCKEKGLKSEGKENTLISRLLRYDDGKSKQADKFISTLKGELEFAPTKIEIQENYFLQIKSTNLSNYFTFGYFYPLALEDSEIYKNENRAKDILSTFEDYIIIGKSPFNQFESNDVLVELVLSGISVTEFENSGLFYVTEPIPVSR